jgi:hypothetical protein
MENRDQLLKSYTDMLNKENAETDRYMHEVESYQHFLLKNTPTPNKNQYELQAMVCSESKGSQPQSTISSAPQESCCEILGSHDSKYVV